MHTSKLIAILQSLSKKEVQRLDKFLQMPYFVNIKQKQKALDLFNYIKKHLSNPKHPRLGKEQAFAAVFQGETFSGSRMDKVMASLVTLIKKFIVLEYANIEEDETQVLLIQSRFYRHKQLDKFFRQTISQLKQAQKKKQKKDKSYYFIQYLIEREQSAYAEFYSTRKEDLNLPNTIRSLDNYFILARLEYANGLIAQHNLHVPLDVKDSLKILETIAPIIESDFAPKEPLIAIYFLAVQLMRDVVQQEQIYLQFREMLNKYENLIPPHQMKSMQAICRSFCVRQHNRGNKVYLKEAFQLYKDHLKKGYLYYNDGMMPGMMKNLVNLGLQLGEQDWVLQFLLEHENKIIGTKSPQAIYHYNLANYYFTVGDYSKVINYLMMEYPSDTYYKIATKRLELKVYYESQPTLLESKMNAFKIYLFRVSDKLLPEVPRTGNRNFINLLWQLHHPQTLGNQQRIDKLVEKIKSLGVIAEREWLLEKLNALRTV